MSMKLNWHRRRSPCVQIDHPEVVVLGVVAPSPSPDPLIKMNYINNVSCQFASIGGGRPSSKRDQGSNKHPEHVYYVVVCTQVPDQDGAPS